jgi:hypothetical protein
MGKPEEKGMSAGAKWLLDATGKSIWSGILGIVSGIIFPAGSGVAFARWLKGTGASMNNSIYGGIVVGLPVLGVIAAIALTRRHSRKVVLAIAAEATAAREAADRADTSLRELRAETNDNQPSVPQNVTTSPVPDTIGIVREARIQMERGAGTCRCECVVDFHDFGLGNTASPKQLSVVGPGGREISTLTADALVTGTGTVTYTGDVNVSVIDACMGAFHPSIEFCPIEIRIAQDSRLAHGASHVKLDYELGPLLSSGDLHKEFLVHVKGAKVHWPADLNAKRRDEEKKESEHKEFLAKDIECGRCRKPRPRSAFFKTPKIEIQKIPAMAKVNHVRLPMVCDTCLTQLMGGNPPLTGSGAENAF